MKEKKIRNYTDAVMELIKQHPHGCLGSYEKVHDICICCDLIENNFCQEVTQLKQAIARGLEISTRVSTKGKIHQRERGE